MCENDPSITTGPIMVVHGDWAAKPQRTVRALGGAEHPRRCCDGACAEPAEVVASEVQDGDEYGDWMYCDGVQEA